MGTFLRHSVCVILFRKCALWGTASQLGRNPGLWPLRFDKDQYIQTNRIRSWSLSWSCSTGLDLDLVNSGLVNGMNGCALFIVSLSLCRQRVLGQHRRNEHQATKTVYSARTQPALAIYSSLHLCLPLSLITLTPSIPSVRRTGVIWTVRVSL